MEEEQDVGVVVVVDVAGVDVEVADVGEVDVVVDVDFLSIIMLF